MELPRDASWHVTRPSRIYDVMYAIRGLSSLLLLFPLFMALLPRFGKIQVTVNRCTRELCRLLALLFLLAVLGGLLFRSCGQKRLSPVQLFPSENGLHFVQIERFILDQGIGKL